MMAVIIVYLMVLVPIVCFVDLVSNYRIILDDQRGSCYD